MAEELLIGDPNIKVIFITGMSSEVIKERIKDLPYLAIIEKPIDLDNLLGMIKKH